MELSADVDDTTAAANKMQEDNGIIYTHTQVPHNQMFMLPCTVIYLGFCATDKILVSLPFANNRNFIRVNVCGLLMDK